MKIRFLVEFTELSSVKGINCGHEFSVWGRMRKEYVGGAIQ